MWLLKSSSTLVRCHNQLQKLSLCQKCTRLFTRECSTTSSRRTSALYVRKHEKNFGAFRLNLKLDEKLLQMDDLDANLKARKMENQVNIFEMAARYQDLQKFQLEKKELEKQKTELVDAFNMESDEQEKNDLRLEIRAKKEEIKVVEASIIAAEEIMYLQGLLLPTDIHSSTPKEDTVVEERDFPLGNSSDSEPYNHVEIGGRMRLLAFSTLSSGSAYLKGELAMLQLELAQQLEDFLDERDYIHISGPDFFKTAVLEGSGEDFDNSKKVYSIQPKSAETAGLPEGSLYDKVDRMFYLTGSASSSVFTAFLAKHDVRTDHLPMKLYSSGQHYAPASKGRQSTLNHGLLASPQKAAVDLFIVSSSESDCYNQYQETCDALWQLYTTWRIPVRRVVIGVEHLQPHQSAKTEIQAWLPGLCQYATISEVSMSNDYVSQRLAINCCESYRKPERDPIYTVHGQALNVTNAIAAFMENCDTKGGHIQLPISITR